MRIATVIPLYNGASYVAEAIDSVLAQTTKSDEIIVVDDGSTDGGAALIRQRYGSAVHVIVYPKNRGLSAARNTGIWSADADLIALIDHDDVWYPEHLEHLSHHFQIQGSNLGWVYSDFDFCDVSGTITVPSYLHSSYFRRTYPDVRHPKLTLDDFVIREMMILPSATLLLRAGWERVGGFDENLRGFEDEDMWRRLFLAGYGNAFLTQPLMRYRHGGGANLSSSATMSFATQAYAAKLAAEHPQYQAAIARRFARNAITSSLRHSLRQFDAIRFRRALRDARHHLSFLPLRNWPYLVGDVMRWMFWRPPSAIWRSVVGNWRTQAAKKAAREQ